jgi:uncharacterized protein YxeA
VEVSLPNYNRKVMKKIIIGIGFVLLVIFAGSLVANTIGKGDPKSKTDTKSATVQTEQKASQSKSATQSSASTEQTTTKHSCCSAGKTCTKKD